MSVKTSKQSKKIVFLNSAHGVKEHSLSLRRTFKQTRDATLSNLFNERFLLVSKIGSCEIHCVVDVCVRHVLLSFA
jgi:hypothetical protein